MRKVKPEDEIPVEFLEENQIKRRIADMSRIKFSDKTLKMMQELQVWIEGNQRKDSTIFMERVYETADQYMKDVMPFAVCRTGCAHCCNDIPVEVTLVEAAYISDKTGIEVNKKAANLTKASAKSKGPCPFLNKETATCSIYEYRPLACRLFATIDHHELCVGRYVEHYFHTIRSNQFWSWLGEGMVTISTAHVGHKKKRYQPVSEIRSYFKNARIVN